jgi:hypothetical protein
MRRNGYPDSRFLCRPARAAFVVRKDRSRRIDTLNLARQTGRIDDRRCPTRDEMQRRSVAAVARRLCSRTRRSTHPLGRMPRIEECLAAGGTRPTNTRARWGFLRATRASRLCPAFQVDFFRRFCVESCDFLRRAWPCHTAGPTRFGDLRARPETATSSGFPEAHPVGTFGPLQAGSGRTRAAFASL